MEEWHYRKPKTSINFGRALGEFGHAQPLHRVVEYRPAPGNHWIKSDHATDSIWMIIIWSILCIIMWYICIYIYKYLCVSAERLEPVARFVEKFPRDSNLADECFRGLKFGIFSDYQTPITPVVQLRALKTGISGHFSVKKQPNPKMMSRFTFRTLGVSGMRRHLTFKYIYVYVNIHVYMNKMNASNQSQIWKKLTQTWTHKLLMPPKPRNRSRPDRAAEVGEERTTYKDLRTLTWQPKT